MERRFRKTLSSTDRNLKGSRLIPFNLLGGLNRERSCHEKIPPYFSYYCRISVISHGGQGGSDKGVASQILSIFLLIRSSRLLSFRSVSQLRRYRIAGPRRRWFLTSFPCKDKSPNLVQDSAFSLSAGCFPSRNRIRRKPIE